MDDRIHVRMLTPDGVGWEGRVCSVTLPTADGSLGVLGSHAPMLCAVAAGVVKCRNSAGESFRLRISDGVAGVEKDELTLLLSSVEALE